MYKDTDVIWIMTTKIGYIPQLRMSGPIPNPIKCPISICIAMLTAGIPLYQFDPASKDIVKLTLENVKDDHKFTPHEIEAVIPTPAVDMKPTSDIVTDEVVESSETETTSKPEDKNDSEKSEVNNVEVVESSETETTSKPQPQNQQQQNVGKNGQKNNKPK